MAVSVTATPRPGLLARIPPQIRPYLPSGRALPEAAWARRHAGVTALLWVHVPAVVLFGVFMGYGLGHSLVEATPVAIAAALASWTLPSRSIRAVAASLGLMVASGVLVHLAGGYVEMHFHFFVMVGVIALYQSWLPFLVSIAFVVLHHAVLGVIDPASVFNHSAAQQQPLLWATIHGGFVLAAAAVSMTAWRLVEHQSLHDILTGLPNRTLFGDRVAHAIVSSSRTGQQMTVLFLDLDGFKQVNDSLGHDGGDELLKVVAQRLSTSVRVTDSVARYGGDEFAVLLIDTPTPEGVVTVVARILANLSEPVQIHGRTVVPKASIGIAMSRATDSPDALIRNADLAMYMAKSRGLAGYEFFEPSMRAALVDRVRIRQDLRVAVDEDMITVAYQPVMDLESGALVGAEALARWTHPERGPVTPSEFIPIAEESDLIVRIGYTIIGAACQRLAEWRQQGLVDGAFAISVNLSTRQLRDPELPRFVKATLDANGLAPGSLVLEITENVLLQDSEENLTQLETLRSLGVPLALDDFGTGYSSLSYLRRYPIDIIKIDRSFVAELGKGSANAALVKAITALGTSMSLRTVAEGVEELAQIDELRELGCRYAQGFHFAKPLSADAFVAFATASAIGRQATPS